MCGGPTTALAMTAVTTRVTSSVPGGSPVRPAKSMCAALGGSFTMPYVTIVLTTTRSNSPKASARPAAAARLRTPSLR
jgi:hypothetical protein